MKTVNHRIGSHNYASTYTVEATKDDNYYIVATHMDRDESRVIASNTLAVANNHRQAYDLCEAAAANLEW